MSIKETQNVLNVAFMCASRNGNENLWVHNVQPTNSFQWYSNIIIIRTRLRSRPQEEEEEVKKK